MVRLLLTDNSAFYASQNVAGGFRLPISCVCDLFFQSAVPCEQVVFSVLCREQLLLNV